MASRRMITSETWEDEFFTSLSMFDRLLWLALLTACADDQGRLQNNAALIRSKAFPVDDTPLKQIESGLNTFVKAGRIVSYSANGKPYIQILNWWKHQTPRWAGKSNHPAPKGWVDRERYHGSGNAIIESNWKSPGGYIADSIGGNTINDVNGDGDINGDGDKPPASPPPTYQFQDAVELSAFQEVTGMTTYPGKEIDRIVDAMNGLRLRYPTKPLLVTYLTPYFQEWTKRGYSKANTAWLVDWALSGEIPQPRGAAPGKNGAKTQTLQELGFSEG